MEFDEWYFAWYNKRYCEGLSESDALELYNRVHTDKKIQSVRDLMYFSWLESVEIAEYEYMICASQSEPFWIEVKQAINILQGK